MDLLKVGNKLRDAALELRKKADYYENIANDMDIVADELNGSVSRSAVVDPMLQEIPAKRDIKRALSKKARKAISKKARKAISKAQKARWAAFHAAKKLSYTLNVHHPNKARGAKSAWSGMTKAERSKEMMRRRQLGMRNKLKLVKKAS